MSPVGKLDFDDGGCLYAFLGLVQSSHLESNAFGAELETFFCNSAEHRWISALAQGPECFFLLAQSTLYFLVRHSARHGWNFCTGTVLVCTQYSCLVPSQCTENCTCATNCVPEMARSMVHHALKLLTVCSGTHPRQG